MNIIFKPECKTEIIKPTYDLPIIGEPISKTGASANNSNAYGVIVGIIGDGSSRRVRVMTEGYIDYDKVKENYMEYTDEAINALTGITLCSGGKLPTGVQPDWNQNDDTQPDYVKNRPFYTGDPVETVLAEESSVSFVAQGEFYSASFPTSFNAEFGQTYKIYWDGSVYECVCEKHNNAPIIGNQSIMGFGSDTGEPFIILNVSGLNETGWLSGTTDTSASHTISISGVVAMVTKIDEKYIPEGLPYLSKENPTCTGSFSINRKSGTTVGTYSFAEGWDTTASGGSSHAEGLNTTASGDNSHAEGLYTTASGDYSHAEGWGTASGGIDSHAEGHYTKASSNDQHVQGKFNIEDSSDTYAHIVGNGTSDASRSNAHTLDWSGNAWFAGTVEGKALILPSSTEGSTKKFKITVDDSGTITATEVS